MTGTLIARGSADPQALLALAVDVALEAGQLVATGRASASDHVAVKSSPVDVVTAVDTASEELIVSRLLAARPDDGVLGEEGASREGVSGVRWVSGGAIVALVAWIVASLAFALYVSNFGSYNKTYGALGGVVVFLLWLWLTNLAILLGAEFNAETERQTARDTTTGPERPPGERGAEVADDIADGARQR